MRAIGELAGETLKRLGREAPETPANPEPAQIQPRPDLLLRLLEDPLLEPVDKIVWLVIRQQLEAHGTQTPLPSFRQIARRANIASASTVSRAVAVLRITRWITPSNGVGAPAGGRGCTGHWSAGPPVTLVNVLEGDSDYLLFLRRACEHPHAQVRRLAGTVLKAVEAAGPVSLDAAAQAPSMESSPVEGEPMSAPILGECFGFRSAGMVQLQNATGGAQSRYANAPADPAEPVRNLDVQNLDSPPGSRCCLYKQQHP